MGWHVLVPEEARSHLALSDLDLEPTFYAYGDLGRAERIRRRLGRLSPAESLERKVQIEEPNRLELIEALWLGDHVGLTRGEMNLLLDRLPRLRWVYSQRTSFHHLELDAFRGRAVALSNSGDLVSRWVAEFAFACVVAQSKRLPDHARIREPFHPALQGSAFEGRSVCIAGTGNIGVRVAELCHGLGMSVTGLSRSPERFEGVEHPFTAVKSLETDLRETLGTADYLVVAVPSAEGTLRLIGREELRSLPPSGCLISVTHPEILDQSALFEMLREGKLAAAYLDRVARRPESTNVPNLVLTHNSSAHVPEKTMKALRRFVAGLKVLGESGEVPDRIA